MRSWCWALVVLGVAGCAGAVELRYEYAVRTRERSDFFVSEGGRDPGQLGPEQRAIVLVPEGVILSGLYQGPARVFFAPGKRSFGAQTDGDKAKQIASGSFEFEIDLVRGHAYEIRVQETRKDLRFAIVDLGPETYDKLHRGDRVQATLPDGAPMAAPLLPLGVQADGSVVVPADERLGMPALHFSAPLFNCPAPALTALASSQVLAACPNYAPSSPGEIGNALLSCAYEQFGSKGVWPAARPPDVGLCERTLGAGWEVPKQSLLANMGVEQRVAFMRPGGGVWLREPLAPEYIFALTSDGDVVAAATKNGRRAPPGYPIWLRCVREATTPAPKVNGDGRCAGGE